MNTISMNSQSKGIEFWLGIVACWLVCVGDFIVNFILGLNLAGYNALIQTQSFLGRAGTSTAPYVAIWGVFFSLLFWLFARSWYGFFSKKTKTVAFSTGLLVLYGLGEGLGSGLVHFSQINGHSTISGLIHQAFSMSADVGLFIFPFFVLRLFPERHPGLPLLTWIVVLLGLALNICFLLGKYFGISYGFLSLSGLLQRLFLADYYLYLLILTLQMGFLHIQEQTL
jgi:hypothetical protein